MKLATRYGLVAVIALALLSIIHWARERSFGSSQLYLYLLGVLPNSAAALAIPFVVLGIWADQIPDAAYSAARRWFGGSAALSAAGLIAMEFTQQISRKLVSMFMISAQPLLGSSWPAFCSSLSPRGQKRTDAVER